MVLPSGNNGLLNYDIIGGLLFTILLVCASPGGEGGGWCTLLQSKKLVKL